MAALNAAQSAGARVVNMSYGPATKGDVFNPGELNIFKNYRSSMVLVKAAGNDGVDVRNERFTGNASVDLSHILIVGSVDANNNISSFSNRPGSACIGACGANNENATKNFFLVAPGESILSDLPKNSVGLLSGTSMAAPHVAGAAALVYQYALAGNTQLEPSQVAGILKCSAHDLGAPGVDAVYGWGLLDVAAALQPCGGISFATGGTVNSGVVSLRDTTITSSSLVSSSAMQNALSSAVVFDDYKRGFTLGTSKVGTSVASALSPNFVEELNGQVGASTVELSHDGQSSVSLTSKGDFGNGGFRVIDVERGNLHFASGLGASASYFTTPTEGSQQSFGRSMAETFFTGSGDAALSLKHAMFFDADVRPTSRLTLSGLYLRTTPAAFDQMADNVAALMLNKQTVSSLLKFGANYRLLYGLSAGVSYGVLQEQGQLLGMQAGGAFGMGDGVTYIGGIHANAQLTENASLSIFAEQSSTGSSSHNGQIFSIADRWSGSKYGLSLSDRDPFGIDGLVQLKLVRPWQIDRGSLAVRLPVGRELDGTVDYENRIVSVATDQMPWELHASYLRGGNMFSYGAELTMLSHTIVNQTAPEVRVAAAFRWAF
jgi:hypothetical protein